MFNRRKPYIIEQAREDGLNLCIVFFCDWENKYVRLIQRKSIDAIGIPESYRGGRITDLTSLTKLDQKQLRGLFLLHEKIKDMTPISHFTELEVISCAGKCTSAPDLTQFKKLRVLHMDWRKCLQSAVNVTTLERFACSYYPYEDLTPLSHMQELTSLQITASKNLLSLEGIANLKKLKDVVIHDCRQLKSLGDIYHCDPVPSVSLSRTKFITADTPHADLVERNALY